MIPESIASTRDGIFVGELFRVCMPVRASGRVLGVMELVNSDMNIYSRGEMLLQALADYAAIAIENARAVQRIQELSITDDCTGVYNSRHMFTVLAEEVRRSERFGYEFSVLFHGSGSFQEHQRRARSPDRQQTAGAVRSDSCAEICAWWMRLFVMAAMSLPCCCRRPARMLRST